MTDQDIVTRIQTELKALKSEYTALDKRYHITYHSGTSTITLLDKIERVRKRQVELEDALRILAEFE